jgi:hypothetical protein
MFGDGQREGASGEGSTCRLDKINYFLKTNEISHKSLIGAEEREAEK